MIYEKHCSRNFVSLYRDQIETNEDIPEREVIGGRIFCDAVHGAYGKSEQNDKNAWIIDPT